MDEQYIKSSEGLFFLMAGPCVVEGKKITLNTAEHLVEICEDLGIPLIFKSSYKKANRTRIDSFTGIGDDRALEILAGVKSQFNIPVVTDVHSPEEARKAADFVDVLQIPAFLCRQTELLVAAANTGKWVNIKKGQFMSPQSMGFAVEKIRECDNQKVLLTERGTTFGYSDLVVDFRGIPEMKSHGVPVVLDCTHSLQQPNQTAGITGGQPDLIGLIARAGIASGVDGLFMETHPNPSEAMSDGANMLPLSKMKGMLTQLKELSKAMTKIKGMCG